MCVCFNHSNLVPTAELSGDRKQNRVGVGAMERRAELLGSAKQGEGESRERGSEGARFGLETRER